MDLLTLVTGNEGSRTDIGKGKYTFRAVVDAEFVLQLVAQLGAELLEELGLDAHHD